MTTPIMRTLLDRGICFDERASVVLGKEAMEFVHELGGYSSIREQPYIASQFQYFEHESFGPPFSILGKEVVRIGVHISKVENIKIGLLFVDGTLATGVADNEGQAVSIRSWVWAHLIGAKRFFLEVPEEFRTMKHYEFSRLNKKRLTRGKLPLPEYSVINIRSPQKLKGEWSATDRCGVRWHYCRAHVRKHSTAGKVPVRSCWRGNPGLGIIKRIYTA